MANKKTLAFRVAVLEKLVETLMEEGGYQELNQRLQEVEVQLDLRVAAEEEEEEDEEDDSPYPFDDVREEVEGTGYVIVLPNPPECKGLPKYLGYLADAHPGPCWVNKLDDAHVFSTKSRTNQATREIKDLFIRDDKKKQMKRFIPEGRMVTILEVHPKQ